MTTCFQLESRLSDALDGLLSASEKRAADEHLASCPECREKHNRYRIILTAIANQPRSALPVPIRKAHDWSKKLRKRGWIASGRSHWERLPWYVRSSVEGLGIVGLILATVSAAPKIRTLYETSIERSLKDLSDPQEAHLAKAPPLQRKAPQAAAGEGEEHFVGDEIEIDTDAENEEPDPAPNPPKEKAGAGAMQIWRFHLKTESPYESRARIAQMLTAVLHSHGGAGGASLGGTEAPGGIQFDVFVPETLVPEIKQKLEKMAAPSRKDEVGAALGENFTWYKSRSRVKAPAGKSRVVIWLSQI